MMGDRIGFSQVEGSRAKAASWNVPCASPVISPDKVFETELTTMEPLFIHPRFPPAGDRRRRRTIMERSTYPSPYLLNTLGQPCGPADLPLQLPQFLLPVTYYNTHLYLL